MGIGRCPARSRCGAAVGFEHGAADPEYFPAHSAGSGAWRNSPVDRTGPNRGFQCRNRTFYVHLDTAKYKRSDIFFSRAADIRSRLLRGNAVLAPTIEPEVAMPIWQIALILLTVMWVLQAVGTWLQMRHYRNVMRSIEGRWTDGYLGIGNARSSLGRGVILMVVVGPDGCVRELLTMEGRSVLAKFSPLEQFRGCNLASLREHEMFNSRRGRAQALDQAIQQIEKAKSRQPGSSAALSESAA